jgi:glycosyltransferase involved in cell wall biosynthesis
MATGRRRLIALGKRGMRARYGAPVRWGFRGVTSAQIGVVTALDSARGLGPSPDQRREAADRVTMAAKTFERPETARRLVRSARRVFDGRIVIADDSRAPMDPPAPGVDVISLPFNVGVAVGRNAALDAVDTEFVIITDDDIVFTAASGINRMVDYLDRTPEVDLVGFLLVQLPLWFAYDHTADTLFPGHDRPLRAHGEVINGLPVRYKIAQVYLARTEAVQRVRWDEGIRMVDHRDFFSRAAGRVVAVLDPQSHVYHVRTPFKAGYTAYREDVAPDLAYLQRKWSGRSRRPDRAEDEGPTAPAESP